MVQSELTAMLAAWASDAELLVAANFTRRAAVLDALDFLAPDQLNAQAARLHAQLEAVDHQLFGRLRAEIRAGQLAGATLRAVLTSYAGPPDDTLEATSYDHFDTLTNGLFPEPVQLDESLVHDPEMVYYQKTPARIVFELAAKLTPADVLYDLGSGLGQVPLLVQLLSGATARGIEIEPSYCRHAQASAEALNRPQVEFRCADARTADYADATAFYLFTPFTGGIMQQVLARLQQLAEHRPLRLFSYGPSTEALGQQDWLRRLDAGKHLYQLAEFRSAL